MWINYYFSWWSDGLDTAIPKDEGTKKNSGDGKR